MNTASTNSNQSKSSLDYAKLVEIGLEHISTFSAETWTDHNSHDPGITLLEHLCFALTDLAFRTGHPIEDHFMDENGTDTSAPSSSYSPSRILPSRAVTLLDLRKVAIDHRGVRNAWIEVVAPGIQMYLDHKREILLTAPAPNTTDIHLRGLLICRVDLAPGITEEEAKRVLAAVRGSLQAQRNLCEVITGVEVVPTQDVGVCADIEISSEADAVEVAARIQVALRNYIEPELKFRRFEDLYEKGLTPSEILTGPLPRFGFLDDDELAAADLRSELFGSDIVRLIMGIPGVVAVRKQMMTLWRDGEPIHRGEAWVLRLDEHASPRLAVDRSRLALYRRELPIHVDSAETKIRIDEITAANRMRRRDSAVVGAPDGGPAMRVNDSIDSYLAPALGRYREPGRYYTLQDDFPRTHGIGRTGLPASASPERRAQALQFEGYMLLFEQLLADYQAQLQNVGKLFTLDSLSRTTFVQVPADISSLDVLIQQDRATYETTLQELAEDQSRFYRRRHAFLDHLLARFGEGTEDYAVAVREVYGTVADAMLVSDKIRLLRHYVELSRNRSAGFDIEAPVDLWTSSGLAQRLALILGADAPRWDHSTARSCFEVVATDDEERPWAFRVVDEGHVYLSSHQQFVSQEAVEKAISETLLFGRYAECYTVRDMADGHGILELKGDLGAVLAWRELSPGDETETEIEAIVEVMRKKPSDERFYVLEHILLHPRAGTLETLPPCLEECGGEDPYSFRVSVILPYWPHRFRDMNFRRFVERTITEQTPAHIFVKICWINQNDMTAFEGAYWPWRKALKQQSNQLSPLQDQLVRTWQTLRSVFPEATLHDCAQDEDSNPVILDNTILGTFEEEDNDGN